jgi:hypothetical protein
MAIWQFDLFVVGRNSMLPRLSDDGWELPLLPAQSTLAAQRRLIDYLGRPWLMMADWIVFGHEESTRFDVFFDSADMAEIRIRLDASCTPADIDAVCVFTRELDSHLFDPSTQSLIDPEPRALRRALNASPAAAYLRDPIMYLSGLK